MRFGISGDARHPAPAGPPHTTRRNHARCDGVVPPARHAGALFPMQRAGSSSEDQGRLEGGEAETKASDGQGQMRTDHLGVRKWQRVPGRQGDRLCQSRVCQAGYVPGATDGSMPVGSVRLFMHFSNITRISVLTHRSLHLHCPLVSEFSNTPFSEAWLIPPLHTNSVIIGLGMTTSVPSTDRSNASGL